MPNPSRPSKRERLARFASRFRSNRTAGSPLLVQTGFPTSLADLVVKNRAKLFMKRKKPPPQLENPDTIYEVVDDRNVVDEDVDSVENSNVIDEEVGSVGLKGGWLGFWVVKVSALGVLAVGGKWFVVGITILASGLLVLEIFGVLKPKSNAIEITNRDYLEIGMGGIHLRGMELVSPIREIESNSSRLDSMSEVLMERRDLDAVRNVGEDQDTAKLRKSKRKRFLGKLFRRKNHKKKDEELSSSSCLDDSMNSYEEEVQIEIKEISDEEYFSFEDTNEVIEIKIGDVDTVRYNLGGIRFERWRKSVFLVVILLGLLGGKGLALVVTVACYLLSMHWNSV